MQVKGTIYGYIHIRSFGGVNLDKNNLFELDKKITNKAQHFCWAFLFLEEFEFKESSFNSSISPAVQPCALVHR
ncbi:hypothetical protein D9M68_625580 [compost metagenome]